MPDSAWDKNETKLQECHLMWPHHCSAFMREPAICKSEEHVRNCVEGHTAHARFFSLLTTVHLATGYRQSHNGNPCDCCHCCFCSLHPLLARPTEWHAEYLSERRRSSETWNVGSAAQLRMSRHRLRTPPAGILRGLKPLTVSTCAKQPRIASGYGTLMTE